MRLWHEDTDGILIYMMLSAAAWLLQCSCFVPTENRDRLRPITARIMESQIHSHIRGFSNGNIFLITCPYLHYELEARL